MWAPAWPPQPCSPSHYPWRAPTLRSPASATCSCGCSATWHPRPRRRCAASDLRAWRRRACCTRRRWARKWGLLQSCLRARCGAGRPTRSLPPLMHCVTSAKRMGRLAGCGRLPVNLIPVDGLPGRVASSIMASICYVSHCSRHDDQQNSGSGGEGAKLRVLLPPLPHHPCRRSCPTATRSPHSSLQPRSCRTCFRSCAQRAGSVWRRRTRTSRLR
mmetsp:Transcript_17298/g.43929  ORF Transcript_17298/g.43929 Transcript_17298/m.43929 type:complete len:216 (+) Transcript_17298:586-1233(+)